MRCSSQAPVLRALGEHQRAADAIAEARSVLEACPDPGSVAGRLAALGLASPQDPSACDPGIRQLDAAGAPGAQAAARRPVRAGYRPRAVCGPQHGPYPRPGDLPQARGELVAGLTRSNNAAANSASSRSRRGTGVWRQTRSRGDAAVDIYVKAIRLGSGLVEGFTENAQRRADELGDDVAGNPSPWKSPRRANPTVTAGFRCAPLTAPMNKITAITVRPGAATAAARLICPFACSSPPASGGQHQREGAQQLREQPPPFPARVIEVLTVPELQPHHVVRARERRPSDPGRSSGQLGRSQRPPLVQSVLPRTAPAGSRARCLSQPDPSRQQHRRGSAIRTVSPPPSSPERRERGVVPPPLLTPAQRSKASEYSRTHDRGRCKQSAVRYPPKSVPEEAARLRYRPAPVHRKVQAARVHGRSIDPGKQHRSAGAGHADSRQFPGSAGRVTGGTSPSSPRSRPGRLPPSDAAR